MIRRKPDPVDCLVLLLLIITIALFVLGSCVRDNEAKGVDASKPQTITAPISVTGDGNDTYSILVQLGSSGWPAACFFGAAGLLGSGYRKVAESQVNSIQAVERPGDSRKEGTVKHALKERRGFIAWAQGRMVGRLT